MKFLVLCIALSLVISETDEEKKPHDGKKFFTTTFDPVTNNPVCSTISIDSKQCTGKSYDAKMLTGFPIKVNNVQFDLVDKVVLVCLLCDDDCNANLMARRNIPTDRQVNGQTDIIVYCDDSFDSHKLAWTVVTKPGQTLNDDENEDDEDITERP